MAKGNGQLVLQPTLQDLTEEELEQRIEQVRARRIVAAMAYIEGQQFKHEMELDKAERKMAGHYEMLGKELERLDRAIEACERRVKAITILKNEVGVMEDY